MMEQAALVVVGGFAHELSVWGGRHWLQERVLYRRASG